MSQLETDTDAACSALLTYLDSLSPLGAVLDGIFDALLLPVQNRNSINEYRKDLDDLTRQLGRCYWMTEVLLRSLDDIKESQALLKERRSHVLDKANLLVNTSSRAIYFPYDILSHIAQFVHTQPLSMTAATQLRTSGRKWDKIVLEASIIRIDNFDFIDPSSLTPMFTNTSATKLYIDLDVLNLDKGVRILGPFSARWHTLCLQEDVDGDFGRTSLFAFSCPNCPKSLPVYGTRQSSKRMKSCKNHTILSSLSSLNVPFFLIPSLSGLIRNIQRLGLVVTRQDSTYLDFSALVTETPHLSELTVIWDTLAQSRPEPRGERAPTLLPNLKKVIFIQKKIALMDQDGLATAFRALDGSRVEELSLHALDTTDFGVVESVMRVLGRKFPSVKSLELRMSLSASDYQEGVLTSQEEFLGALDPTEFNGHMKIFPHLAHLSVEFDYSLEGFRSLSPMLLKGCGFIQRIKSLELFARVSPHDVAEIRGSDFLDFLGRIQNKVPNVTIRNIERETHALDFDDE